MDKSINTMTVEEILKKEAFRRAKPLPLDAPERGGNSDYNANLNYAPLRFSYLSQDDFLREFDPASHAINSVAYYPNLFFKDDANGHNKWKVKVRSRVSVAWQKRIHTKRLVALTGYDPDISIAKSRTDSASQENLAKFKEGWMTKGMDTAIHLAISADLKVGDTAICGYKDKNRFGYRLLSYDKGDILYPHYDPMTGELSLFARRFTKHEMGEDGKTHDVTYLDVWDTDNYIQYRQSDTPNKSGNLDWIVSEPLKPHSFGFCPVAYHRYGEPCWAASQSLIDQHELAMSQLAENNAQYALRILYTLGAEFEMEGSSDGTPRLINSTDPAAKVGYLEPADSSTSFELQLKSLEREIMRCSFAVESPELKSGADLSSLTVKTLMADSYLKAVDDAKCYQSFLDDVVRIFIEGYGTESDNRVNFLNLNVQIHLQPWVFMAESEVVNTLVQLCSIGVLSKQSATEYVYETLGLGSVDEAKRILQEAHDVLIGSQQTALDRQTNNPVNNARKLNAETNA